MIKKDYTITPDIIRIIAGFGVVLIHVTDPFLAYPPYVGFGGSSWWIINIINTAFRFSVPVFIILSGYLLLNPDKHETVKTFYKKRFWRVGIPFLFWIPFYFLWYPVIERPLTPEIALERLFTANLDHLYFLIIILELYFITPFLRVFSRNSSHALQTMFVISISLFTMAVSMLGLVVPDALIPFRTNFFTIFIPFICYYFLGYYLRNFQLSVVKSIWVFNGYLNLVILTTLLSAGVVTSFIRQYESPTLFVMSVSVFLLLFHNAFWNHLLKYKHVVRFVRHLSETIFGVYLVHMFVISLLDKYFKLGPGNIHEPMWIWVILKIGIVTLLSYLFVVVCRKIFFIRPLFG